MVDIKEYNAAQKKKLAEISKLESELNKLKAPFAYKEIPADKLDITSFEGGKWSCQNQTIFGFYDLGIVEFVSFWDINCGYKRKDELDDCDSIILNELETKLLQNNKFVQVRTHGSLSNGEQRYAAFFENTRGYAGLNELEQKLQKIDIMSTLKAALEKYGLEPKNISVEPEKMYITQTKGDDCFGEETNNETHINYDYVCVEITLRYTGYPEYIRKQKIEKLKEEKQKLDKKKERVDKKIHDLEQ